MNSSVPTVLLLLCITACILQKKGDVAAQRCRCIALSRSLTRATVARIVSVKTSPPNPFCDKTEIIVILKDGISRCLDPSTDFTKRLLQKISEKQKSSSSVQMTTTSPSSTLATAAYHLMDVKGDAVAKRCRCINLSQSLTRATAARITFIKTSPPNRFCSKTEVIAILRDGTSKCLDPSSNFTKRLLQKLSERQKSSSSVQMTTTSPNSTLATAAYHLMDDEDYELWL
ncbi:uncharacterized protein LOC115376095 isoform X1 [Myripristis murdjan]|uniref:uncharacterized protein LOC115376095 isoform X1 n=1 Tax=Myripristis murdjan TaxID=586833 RepID=UPI001175DC23|nr:uncharacterized protein LOC115376095 isoform X1 [Myripristis murdjan]